MSLAANLRDVCSVYRNVRPTDVAHLWARRLKLRLTPLLARPTTGLSNQRVVISLTTIPSRISRIKSVLHSLLDQDQPAHEVILALPTFSKREQRAYCVPRFIRDCPSIRLLECEDWGPATKLLPAVIEETSSNAIVIAVDDDVIYPQDFVRTLIHWHEHYPDAALGYRGWSVTPSLRWSETQTRYATELDSPLPVDVVTGTWGILVRPSFFDSRLFDYSGFSKEAFYVDDLWINGNLARRGIPRFVVPSRMPPMSTLISRVNGLIFQENRDGRNNDVVLQEFSEYWSSGDPQLTSRTPLNDEPSYANA